MQKHLLRLIASLLPIFALFCLSGCGKKQPPKPLIDEAHPMVIADNISNQTIRQFAEDQYGQIWIATFRGLNKFDGHQYYQYFCTDDSTGLPDNNINDILIDKKHRVWVATVNGICRYTSKNTFERIGQEDTNHDVLQLACAPNGAVVAFNMFTLQVYDEKTGRFICKTTNLDSRKTFIGRMVIDRDNQIWHINLQGLSCYSTPDMRCLRKIPMPKDFLFISASLLDGHLLWLQGATGLRCFDTEKHSFVSLPASLLSDPRINNDHVNSIHRFNKDMILLSTVHNGMLAFDEKDQKLIAADQPSFPFQQPDFKVTTMFTDSHHNLWMGSEDQGFSVNYQYSAFFNNNTFLEKAIGHQSVLALAADRHNNLFISTKMKGLCVYNLDTHTLTQVHIQGIEADNKKTEISSLLVDSKDNLWLTSGLQAVKARYAGSRLEVLHRYPVFYAMSLCEDRNGTVWASQAAFSAQAFLPDGSAKTVQAYPATFCFMPCIKLLRDGRLLTAAFNQDLTAIDPRSFTVQRLSIPKDSLKKGIRRSVFIPTDMLQTDDTTLFVGTVTNGLIRISLPSGKTEQIHGLSCSDISAIILDKDRNMWVSTMNGLNRIDHQTGAVTSFYETDGTGGNQFYDRAACLLPNGELVFGGTHGLTFFNPKRHQSRERVKLVFETLKVHNQLVAPSKDGCIDSSMERCPTIKIHHNDNSFSIGFAALAYGDHERVNYYYKLEGFDDDWVEAGNRREANYANLPSGHYTLKVIARSKGYPAFAASNELSIVVYPAPWNSWWAWMIYIALTAFILVKIRAIRIRILHKNLEIQQARREKEHEKKINSMNMSFFANISHEFRTPLTMIAGPVDMLCDDPDIKGEKKQLLTIIRRSVARMLTLVNQLMDFNKLENDTLQLKVRRGDIIGLLRRICDIFLVNAREKNIAMKMEGLEGSFLMMIDPDKIDKIVTNLLSNAMKFTPMGGSITVSFDVADNKAVIRVSDTGPGIPANELENIFKRFYQLDDRKQGVYNWGTGIGLYFSRRLAQLHHGSLTASNREEGHGAVFTLCLPANDSAYQPEEQAIPEGKQQDKFPIKETSAQILDQQAGNEDKPVILVVDDDTEVVNYLQTILLPYYRVIYRFDADSAYKSACEDEPNVILSDVIMPDKDGYEFCREVKQNLEICHIPVILVTAKATVENQIEGLNTGADAYITKPFDPKLLLAMIHSLLDNREKLKQMLTHSTQTTGKMEAALAPQDRNFMEQLYHIMEEELSNEDIDVTHLTAMLHISRTKLYYKLKGLTGSTPSAFFKMYKLNRAAELIREGKYTISEVADMTGFNTPSHFSTSFKKQFGVSPSEFV